jgi:dolichol-phosphate mannosyltransferase
MRTAHGPELRRPPIKRVAVVVPCCYGTDRLEQVLAGLRVHVEQVVLVDDGTPPKSADCIDRAAASSGVQLLRLARNGGKGSAVAAGARLLLECPQPPDAVAVIDADGQHPAEHLPELLAALADADVVIGDRMGDAGAMPWLRRTANRAFSALLSAVLNRPIPDSQCGMRVFRASALAEVPLPDGRYEAETRHLKAAVKSGLAVVWVPIPAIYAHRQSAFRPAVDSARVLVAILTPQPLPRAAVSSRTGVLWRAWATRLGVLLAGRWR